MLNDLLSPFQFHKSVIIFIVEREKLSEIVLLCNNSGGGDGGGGREGGRKGEWRRWVRCGFNLWTDGIVGHAQSWMTQKCRHWWCPSSGLVRGREESRLCHLVWIRTTVEEIPFQLENKKQTKKQQFSSLGLVSCASRFLQDYSIGFPEELAQ